MKRMPYKLADAFTGENSRGNPAAFLLTEDELPSADCLAIAKDHAGFVSELVFCQRAEEYPYKLRYYSSECEVDFCGHGTIAAMYELIRGDAALRKLPCVRVETKRKGVITVFNRILEEDAVYVTAPAPKYLSVPADGREIAAALGLDAARIDGERPIDFIDAGLRTLIVPLPNLSETVSLRPDLQTLKAFCLAAGVDIVLVYTLETSRGGFLAHTRVFAPKFGYLEDPATGSGNSAFGYYLIKNALWSGEAASVEQGGAGIAYNTVKLTVRDGTLLFGGKASARIEGYYLYERPADPAR